MANRTNLGTSTVATAPSPATSGTTVTVQTGHASRFPGFPFYATMHPDGVLPTLDNAEIVLVTLVSTDTFTITRAQKGTSAKSVAIGWRISNVVVDEDAVPVGSVMPFAGPTAPTGWLFCYGQALDAGTNPIYQALYDVIGNTYGGTNSSNFVVPDMRGRVPAGQDDMGGSSANRLTGQTGGVDGDVLAATGGAETHTLTVAQMPSHTHIQDAHSHQANFGTLSAGTTRPAGSNSGSAGTGGGILNETATNQNTGGDGAHNNVQPTIILNYIIKY